ncbi:MAG: hypothetical protein ABSD88_18925 [Candidatus Korobacteraceae bacterium]|jgi:hypothetical protein
MSSFQSTCSFNPGRGEPVGSYTFCRQQFTAGLLGASQYYSALQNLISDFARQGIRQPECNEVNARFALPMRQVSAGTLANCERARRRGRRRSFRETVAIVG